VPLLSATEITACYETSGGLLRAVDGISLDIEAGETVGVVGESGSGKSTLGKTLLRLITPTNGSIVFGDVDIARLSDTSLRPFRRRMQMVFQDPFASLNPRHTIGDILTAPLTVHAIGDREQRRRRVLDMLDRVGLSGDALSRYPHEFSGGQRQRIGIARALILEPELLVCDEPVSALDLSIQAQILNLLAAMKRDLRLSYLFISHDLSVINYFSDRVLVMYLGRIVESADNRRLWAKPAHPYTRALIAAVPDAARRRQAVPLTGDVPSARALPQGCRFHPRCPLATDLCRQEEPYLREIAPGHSVACHQADA
jgi:peptide/nickel transport system ATP-binding protein